jgi:peptidoglycan/LPS O-acetylase OafA/YrhL
MMPAFFVVLLALFAIYTIWGHLPWVEYHPAFPLWTYATFTQNFYMVADGSIGPHWLAPTWTLAVEEHFYLVAPAALMFTPRRHLMKGLMGLAVLALGLRIAVFWFGVWPPLAGRVLLPMLADTLIAGIASAVLLRRKDIDWSRYDYALRLSAPVGIVLAALGSAVDRQFGTHFFPTVGTSLIAIASAGLILAIMRGAPEAKRFESPILCFFGHMSYCIYLTHLAVLGLMHGLILGATPDLATWQQAAVTTLAFPVTVAVGWLLYKAVEEPGLNYGRRWAWSKERRASAEPLDVASAARA